uniref:MADF domain-containing protein n=1 Tax=Strigamia maritima TaxID=126957 RepID=T1ITM9_STRMM
MARAKVNNEALIEFVRNFPFLYNTSDVRYKDTALKEKRWAVIGAQQQVSSAVVKKRWKTLRDRYRKEMLEYEKKRSGGNMDVAPPKWKLYPVLGALLDNTMSSTSHLLDADSCGNISNGNDDMDDDEDVTNVNTNNIEVILNETEVDSDESCGFTLATESKKPNCTKRLKREREDELNERMMSALDAITDNLSARLIKLGQQPANDEAYFYAMSL